MQNLDVEAKRLAFSSFLTKKGRKEYVPDGEDGKEKEPSYQFEHLGLSSIRGYKDEDKREELYENLCAVVNESFRQVRKEYQAFRGLLERITPLHSGLDGLCGIASTHYFGSCWSSRAREIIGYGPCSREDVGKNTELLEKIRAEFRRKAPNYYREHGKLKSIRAKLMAIQDGELFAAIEERFRELSEETPYYLDRESSWHILFQLDEFISRTTIYFEAERLCRSAREIGAKYRPDLAEFIEVVLIPIISYRAAKWPANEDAFRHKIDGIRSFLLVTKADPNIEGMGTLKFAINDSSILAELAGKIGVEDELDQGPICKVTERTKALLELVGKNQGKIALLGFVNET